MVLIIRVRRSRTTSGFHWFILFFLKLCLLFFLSLLRNTMILIGKEANTSTKARPLVPKRIRGPNIEKLRLVRNCIAMDRSMPNILGDRCSVLYILCPDMAYVMLKASLATVIPIAATKAMSAHLPALKPMLSPRRSVMTIVANRTMAPMNRT